MAHVYHPREFGDPLAGLASNEPILYDDCDRCAEHARHPLSSLDRQFTGALWRKMVLVEHEHEGRYRSGAEADACRLLYDVAVYLQRFTRVDPWTLDVGPLGDGSITTTS